MTDDHALMTLDQAAALVPGRDELPDEYRSVWGKPDIVDRISVNMHRNVGKRRCCVYFIGNRLFVKIGYTTNIFQRLGDLDAMSPFALDVLLLVKGGFDVERTLHDRFARYWIKGEWFRHDGALAEFIAVERVKFA